MKKIYFILSLVVAGMLQAHAIDVWDGTRGTGFASGTGTLADPYIISTCAQLAYLADQVNTGTPGTGVYAGVYFKLIDDLDLNNKPWTPIGTDPTTTAPNSGTDRRFLGIFDGNGHVVRNMNVTGYGGLGLFGQLRESTPTSEIKNLGLDNFTVTSTSTGALYLAVGGLLGTQNSATLTGSKISNCYATNGTITFSSPITSLIARVGGFCGRPKGTIINCYARVNINVTLGANVTLTSVNTFAGANAAAISNSYSCGTVTVTPGSYVLTATGLKPFADAGTITNCLTTEVTPGTGAVVSGVTSQTDTQLKGSATTLGTAWTVDLASSVNAGFPILTWQNPVATAATNVSVTALKVHVNQGILRVENAPFYSVYTASGVKVVEVAKNTASTEVHLNAGIYVVKAGKDVQKVVLK